MYKKMLEIRRFEEKALELYYKGLVPGYLHPCIGEEAVAVGVCTALQKTDYVIGNHRSHGHSIAKGVPSKVILSELLAKETGVCKAIGGSMHITDTDHGVLLSTGIVGGGIPIASGVGLALKLSGNRRVVACFFGDGATNIGSFHEGINLASLWKLPVIFVCENNLYAVSTNVKRSVSAKNIVDRATAYDMPGEQVDGMDIIAVHTAAIKAVERARKGEGPTLLECRTYRYHGHGAYDTWGLDYRTKIEIEEWMKRDPINMLRKKIIEENITTQEGLSGIEEEIQGIIEDAVEFAINSPPPPSSLELLLKMVYA